MPGKREALVPLRGASRAHVAFGVALGPHEQLEGVLLLLAARSAQGRGWVQVGIRSWN